jgi:UDP:flavonoid glycosyltransferase YjiC (YdhE family)
MRVLCSTTPMEGVFGPFVALGRALVDAGHEVIVATGADLPERLTDTGLTFEAVGLSAMEGVMAAMADPDVKAAPPGDHIEFPAMMFGSVIPTAKIPGLRVLAETWRPDLVIHPPVDLAGPLLATEMALPSVCYGFNQPLDPGLVSAMRRRVGPLWEEAGMDVAPHAGIYRGAYLDPCPPTLRVADQPPAAEIQLIRPELPGDSHAQLPSWADRLGARPVVYVSLGTAPLFNQPARFAPLLEGLVAEDVEVVVTISKLHDPAALGELPATVHVERWLPLAPLLPLCDAVVCHAGTGTTLAGLVAGLPLVLVPRGADQFDNARGCERAGAARVLMPDEVSAEAVRDAVRAVLAEGAPERSAAASLAREIAGMPSAASVVQRLEQLVARDGALA